MKKSHYTYLLYNGKQFYIGVRSCEGLPEEDYNYLGSSTDKAFKNSIVAKTILRVFKTRKEASLHEIKLHQFHDVGVNPKFANKAKATSTGFCRKGLKHSKETLAKISASSKGRKLSAEAKAKLYAANKGRKHTEKTKAKLSAANKGKKHTAESKAKMSAASKGRKHSEKTRAKLSAVNKGKKLSREHKDKLSAAKKGLNHPKADHTVYMFSHKNGETFTGTRFEFTEKYKICVGPLFKKRHYRFTAKGWRATCKLL